MRQRFPRHRQWQQELQLPLPSPELEPVLKGVILLGWAYAEGIYDVRQLLSGRHVVLFKTADTWKLGIENALEGIAQGSSEEEGKEDSTEGLDYQDYLRVLLLLGEEETQIFRMMDVIEMNIRSLPAIRVFAWMPAWIESQPKS